MLRCGTSWLVLFILYFVCFIFAASGAEPAIKQPEATDSQSAQPSGVNVDFHQPAQSPEASETQKAQPDEAANNQAEAAAPKLDHVAIRPQASNDGPATPATVIVTPKVRYFSLSYV